MRQEPGPVHTPTVSANLHTKGQQGLYAGTKGRVLQTLLPRPPLTPFPTQRPSPTQAQGRGGQSQARAHSTSASLTLSHLGDGAGMLFEGGKKATMTQTSSLRASAVLPTIFRERYY